MDKRILSDEELLGIIKKNAGGGGGGGTTNYNQLENKPQIGGVTLTGNKSASDLGLVESVDGKGLSSNDFTDAYKTAIGNNATAISGIKNGEEINSFGGVETALEGKQNTITAGDDLKFSGSTLNVEVSVPYIDEYDLSTNGDNFTVITKKHKGEVVSTDVYPSGIYTTYNIDDCFTLQYGGSPVWIITLTKASTLAPAGTTYGWEYAQTPAVSNIQFELAETGTASEFIADLNDALAGKQDTLTFDNTPTEDSNNPVKSGGIYDALADKANASDVKKEFGGTLEQWNALTTAEKKEYDTYDITDDYSDGNYIYLPTIYSEEEREVGVWKDGKPLYQKTIDFGALPNNTSKSVASGLTGVSVKSIFGTAMAQNGFTVTLPHAELSGAGSIDVSYLADNNVRISTDYDYSAYSSCITLQYTKTTDTAGSGTWTPTGQYAHHYSTDEQIIGTWIDGKTLYRKVIVFDSSKVIAHGSWTNTTIDFTADTFVLSQGIAGDGAVFAINAYVDNGKLNLMVNAYVDITLSKVVLEYTKPTV